MPALSTTRPLSLVCLLTNELLNSSGKVVSKSVNQFAPKVVLTQPLNKFWWGAETRTADPLIGQSQSGPEPNIDKKAQPISRPACFFFDNGRCMFCPGSGTKQAQPW